ncbi:MAG: LysR substrate-binding domain-containing protein [Methyloligellaceae bacterium]
MVAITNTQMPLLDLDLLRTVVAIAETGNFSSAAEVTFRTPSAVSMQVKKMEELLGKAVFKRDSRSVSLTHEGEQLLIHARRVLALNRDIVTQFIQPDVSGVVRLGAPDDISERFLPGFLKLFSESHPCITVDVVVENSSRMIRQIKAKELDLAIITCDPGGAEGFGAESLYRERLVWAGVRGGIACEQNPLPVSVWEEGCAWRDAGLSSLEKIKRDYRIAFKSAHISGQKAAMLADLAVAPIPISSCSDQIVVLGQGCGMPDLPDYELAMITANDANPAVYSAADHIRASFTKKLEGNV